MTKFGSLAIILKLCKTTQTGSKKKFINNLEVCPGDVMVAMSVLEADAERRVSSSLTLGTILKHIISDAGKDRIQR